MKRAALVTGITLALVAGVVFRFWTTSHLWLDEAISVNIAPAAARRPPLGVARRRAPSAVLRAAPRVDGGVG